MKTTISRYQAVTRKKYCDNIMERMCRGKGPRVTDRRVRDTRQTLRLSNYNCYDASIHSLRGICHCAAIAVSRRRCARASSQHKLPLRLTQEPNRGIHHSRQGKRGPQ